MQKASTLFAVCALLLAAIRPEAQTIFAHRGSSDPSAENWTAQSPGPGTSAGPVSNDLGLRVDAWNVSDTSPADFSTLAYSRTPSAGQVAQATAGGWRLSAVLRVVSVPATPDYAITVAYSDGAAAFEMVFGAAPNGDPTVVLATGWDAANVIVKGTNFTLPGGGGTYHRFDLYFDPQAGAARLLVNGIERISGYRGWSNLSPGALLPRVVWGAGSSPGRGNANYSLVEWEIGPAPPVSPPEEEADMIRYDATLGAFPTEQGFRVHEEGRTPPGDRVQPPEMTGGILHQLPTIGLAHQYWYADAPVDLDFESGAYVLEARLRVIDSNYVLEEGVYQKSGYGLYLADRAGRRFLVGLSNDGISINTDDVNHTSNGVPFTPFNTTDAFHTYRLVVSDRMGRLFIDGVEFAGTPVGQAGMASEPNQVHFGDSSWNGRSDTHLQAVRLTELPVRPCGTPVGGVVASQEWTKAGSPYCVTNDLLIAGLTVREGVEVRICGNYVLDVLTPITVQGTAEEPVRFHPCDPEVGWQGLLFRDTGPGSFFVHAIIEGSKNSGIRLTNAPMAFTNCWIINNTAPGNGGGINATITGHELNLVNCLLGTNSTPTGNGAGMSLRARNSMVNLTGCDVVANGARSYGGGVGMMLKDTQVVVHDCRFLTNSLVRTGGDIYAAGLGLYQETEADTFMAAITASRFQGNTVRLTSQGGDSDGYGGGLVVGGGRASIRNCWFSGNEARVLQGGSGDSMGGGIHGTAGAEIEIVNSFVAGNVVAGGAARRGAGITIGSSTLLRLVNCTVMDNQNSVGVYRSSGAVVEVLNSIVFNNNSGGQQMSDGCIACYSCVQNGWPCTGCPTDPCGNIAAQPALCPETYALLPTSPCIDAGHSGLAYRDKCIDSTVCSPYARGTTRNDMGAYGGPGVAGWNPPCPAPAIVRSPRNLIALEGSSAELDVVATDEVALSLLWFKDGLPLVSETNSVLRVEDVALSHAGRYNVEVFNGRANAVSRTAGLMVTDVLVSARLTESQHLELTMRPAHPPEDLLVRTCPVMHDGLVTTNWTTVATLENVGETATWTNPVPASESAEFYAVIRASTLE